MRFLLEALAYILSPDSWAGDNAEGIAIGTLLAQHVGYSVMAVGLAALIGVPAGWWVGHSGRGTAWVQTLSGAVRALPTLGVVTLCGLFLGIGLAAPMTALVVLALPSVLAGATNGVRAADPVAVDGARACGMTEQQILTRVEVPLGAPLLVGGLRSASLQVIATATLAAYTGAGGLGSLMFLGIKTQRYDMVLASALLVILLALASETLFSLLQRVLAPASARGNRKEHA